MPLNWDHYIAITSQIKQWGIKLQEGDGRMGPCLERSLQVFYFPHSRFVQQWHSVLWAHSCVLACWQISQDLVTKIIVITTNNNSKENNSEWSSNVDCRHSEAQDKIAALNFITQPWIKIFSPLGLGCLWEQNKTTGELNENNSRRLGGWKALEMGTYKDKQSADVLLDPIPDFSNTACMWHSLLLQTCWWADCWQNSAAKINFKDN